MSTKRLQMATATIAKPVKRTLMTWRSRAGSTILLGTRQPDKIACRLHLLRRRAVGAPRAALILRDAARAGRIVRRIVRGLTPRAEQYNGQAEEQPAAKPASN
jgi:hypothetical protein